MHIDIRRYEAPDEGAQRKWKTHMFHLTSAGWLVGRNDPSQDLDRMYHVALHEAKVAADYHQHRLANGATAMSQQQRRFRSTPTIR